MQTMGYCKSWINHLLSAHIAGFLLGSGYKSCCVAAEILAFYQLRYIFIPTKTQCFPAIFGPQHFFSTTLLPIIMEMEKWISGRWVSFKFRVIFHLAHLPNLPWLWEILGRTPSVKLRFFKLRYLEDDYGRKGTILKFNSRELPSQKGK